MTAGAPSIRASGPRLAVVRRLPATTPARLGAASLLLVGSTLVFGLAAAGAGAARHRAADEVANGAEVAQAQATEVYRQLSDADATATTTFLIGAPERTDSANQYLADVNAASERLTSLSQETGASQEARDAVQVIAEKLPVYTGLIERARANNQQDFPVGAAYLRDASTLMRDQILPKALVLYDLEGKRLDAAYASGSSPIAPMVVVATGVLLLGLLVVVQVYVARRTRRRLNLALVAATVVVAGVMTWITVGFVMEREALADAQRRGSDAVQLLSAARISALQAQSRENLLLVARQYDPADNVQEALKTAGGLDGKGGLLGDARTIAVQEGRGSQADALATDFSAYVTVHHRISESERLGDFSGSQGAVEEAVGDPSRGCGAGCEAFIAAQVDNDLRDEIAAAQARFERDATDATSAVPGLWLVIPLAVVVISGLIILGLQQRIREYR